MNENVPTDPNALKVEMIGEERVVPKGQPDATGLLTSLIDIPLPELQQGFANLARMVEEPAMMDGSPVVPCAITVGADGQGVNLAAPYNMTCDIPFPRLVALVERMFDSVSRMIVIQEHSVGDRREPSRRQIVGHLDPYYGSLTVFQSYRGEYLTGDNHPEVTQLFYLDRRELLSFYLVAKLHLSGVRRREDMDPYILGWHACDIRHDEGGKR